MVLEELELVMPQRPYHYSPNSRTPYRIEIKFTKEEWEQLGDLATKSQRSRYNYIKHLCLAGIAAPWPHLQRDNGTSVLISEESGTSSDGFAIPMQSD